MEVRKIEPTDEKKNQSQSEFVDSFKILSIPKMKEEARKKASEDFANGLIEMAKMQLQTYATFLGICQNPKEAGEQTTIFMTAMMRSLREGNK